ncbi:MAG TPA: cupredoxin domain-containing protein [Symbiobacteriaceae bacterium]|nr:cupredoxin domain-containing protein [Symbiobacteriaceae bacterium]
MKHATRLLLLGLLLAGCASRPKADATPVNVPKEHPEPVITQTAPKTVAQMIAGQEGVVTVRMTDRGFEPAQIAATLGGRVKLHLKNEAAAGHNLVIQKFGILSRTLGPGEENYIEFTPNLKGDWPIISDAPGEAEPAFKATLKVE